MVLGEIKLWYANFMIDIQYEGRSFATIYLGAFICLMNIVPFIAFAQNQDSDCPTSDLAENIRSEVESIAEQIRNAQDVDSLVEKDIAKTVGAGLRGGIETTEDYLLRQHAVEETRSNIYKTIEKSSQKKISELSGLLKKAKGKLFPVRGKVIVGAYDADREEFSLSIFLCSKTYHGIISIPRLLAEEFRTHINGPSGNRSYSVVATLDKHNLYAPVGLEAHFRNQLFRSSTIKCSNCLLSKEREIQFGMLEGGIKEFSISPDKAYVAIGNRSSFLVRLFNMNSGQFLSEIRVTRQVGPQSLAWATNSILLVADTALDVSQDGILSRRSPRFITQFRGVVEASPNGNYFLTGTPGPATNWRGQLILFQNISENTEFSFTPKWKDKHWITTSAHFLENDAGVLVGSIGDAALYDLKSGKQRWVAKWKGLANEALKIEQLSAHRAYIMVKGAGIVIVNLENGFIVGRLGDKDIIDFVLLKGLEMVAICNSKEVRFIDTNSSKLIEAIEKPCNMVSLYKHNLIATIFNRKATVWRITDQSKTVTPVSFPDLVTNTPFAPYDFSTQLVTSSVRATKSPEIHGAVKLLLHNPTEGYFSGISIKLASTDQVYFEKGRELEYDASPRSTKAMEINYSINSSLIGSHNVTITVKDETGFVTEQLGFVIEISDSKAASSPGAAKKDSPRKTMRVSDNSIRDTIVQNSINSYSGSCPCPFSTDRAGRSCGGRSAYSRANGYSLKCYRNDISDAEIKRYRSESNW